MKNKTIYCSNCEKDVSTRLVTGEAIYPSLIELHSKYFYQCTKCFNYVGCHKNSARPLGCIPSPELREMRRKIHKIIDPLWVNRLISRTELYKLISDKIGYEYHTGEIRNMDDATEILKIATDINDEILKDAP